MSSKFDKLKGKGALDIIDSSVEEKYVADIDPKEEDKVNKSADSSGDEQKFLRSYTLTKKQLTMLQRKKLDEIGLSLSDIVGKAIEEYCSK